MQGSVGVRPQPCGPSGRHGKGDRPMSIATITGAAHARTARLGIREVVGRLNAAWVPRLSQPWPEARTARSATAGPSRTAPPPSWRGQAPPVRLHPVEPRGRGRGRARRPHVVHRLQPLARPRLPHRCDPRGPLQGGRRGRHGHGRGRVLRLNRICQRTGLVLIEGPLTAHRVAKESYGPLNPQERGSLDEDRAGGVPLRHPGPDPLCRSGSRERLHRGTLVGANDPRPPHIWPRRPGSWVCPWRRCDGSWRRNGLPIPAWFPAGSPANWREGRLLYTLEFGAGWWIDMAHAATLTVLNESIGRDLHDDGTAARVIDPVGGHRR